jgi:hypothetical protein
MASRTVYHVLPGRDRGWDVRREGVQRAESHYDRKDEAVSRARDLAKSREPGQVIVHKQDGTIQVEYTYGRDPHPPAG